jgi:gliding motility-associated-like protein
MEKNDTFKVYAEQEAEFISISIFDRWGEKVFTSADINEKWDGLYKGNELAHGVYVYIITARCDKTNEIFNFAGDITIIE